MDELLLSKIRLGVIAELLTAEWIAFSELQRATQTTNGNLGAHLLKLVDAGYVAEEKASSIGAPRRAIASRRPDATLLSSTCVKCKVYWSKEKSRE